MEKLTIITTIKRVSLERGSKITSETQIIRDLKTINHLYKTLQDDPNAKKQNNNYYIVNTETETPNGLFYKKVYYTIRYIFE
jgi:hypothetical protein